MEWALIFILSYTDPNAPQYDAAVNEHATVTSPTYGSQTECETAGAVKMAALNWSEAEGGRLDWICTQNSTYALR